MYQQPISDENATRVDGPSPMRGLLIAAPIAFGLWVAVAEIARFFF